jgi:hypothetical protein
MLSIYDISRATQPRLMMLLPLKADDIVLAHFIAQKVVFEDEDKFNRMLTIKAS